LVSERELPRTFINNAPVSPLIKKIKDRKNRGQLAIRILMNTLVRQKFLTLSPNRGRNRFAYDASTCPQKAVGFF
jgi:predicted transcriptional regulator